MRYCKICGAECPSGYNDTCGNSYCQEASTYNNRANNTRSKTKKAELRAHANACTAKATANR